LEMLSAGVYRPVPLMTTLCTVVPLLLINAGSDLLGHGGLAHLWNQRTNACIK